MEKRKLTVDNNEEQQGELSFSLEGNGCLEGGGIDGECLDGYLIYYDPQNPNNNNKYPLGKLYKLYVIKER